MHSWYWCTELVRIKKSLLWQFFGHNYKLPVPGVPVCWVFLYEYLYIFNKIIIYVHSPDGTTQREIPRCAYVTFVEPNMTCPLITVWNWTWWHGLWRLGWCGCMWRKQHHDASLYFVSSVRSRRYVSTDTFQALVVALVVTRLDYDNAVLTGLCLPVTASAVGLERRRVADFRLTTLRLCVRRADQPTLAAHSAAHPV